MTRSPQAELEFERRSAHERADFKHTGEYVVSAIASLYRGKKFPLKTFLDNITSQTIFDRSELLIIDADSPEGEWEMIEDYRRRFPNIVYKQNQLQDRDI